jgi:hypothetical protein
MTLRYSHLSPKHELDAVRRLHRKPTDAATDRHGDGASQLDDPGRILGLPGKELLPVSIRDLRKPFHDDPGVLSRLHGEWRARSDYRGNRPRLVVHS